MLYGDNIAYYLEVTHFMKSLKTGIIVLQKYSPGEKVGGWMDGRMDIKADLGLPTAINNDYRTNSFLVIYN